MPAIRDEEWFYSPSFKEGAAALSEGTKDVRFCGLMLGQDTLGEDEMDVILESLKDSRTKSVSLDWFEVETKSFSKIAAMAGDDFKYELNAFHLTMIDLKDPIRLSAVASIVSNNKHIVDLILTFCKINCQNVHLLGEALKVNDVILSLNINFNLLRKDGYLTLGKCLNENKTLRYLEAKLNKAEKEDLIEFAQLLQNNHTIEYLDVGQEDDIDGVIEKNKIPEETVKHKGASKEKVIVTKDADNNGNATNDAAPPAPQAPANNNAANAGNNQNTDLFAVIKEYMERNKNERLEAEKQLKIGQLKQILATETPTIRASLKHCKIMMLGDKGVGKTFFTHCLVHQLYHNKDDDNTTPATRKLDHLSLARVTELGWTKITSFQHVDMIIAKRISTLPVNIENRNKANEVCFQFPEQVIISEKDLKTDSLLAKEDKLLLKRLEIDEEEIREKVSAPVFEKSEETAIEERFSGRMNDIIDKALRENNYPSFSIWDVDSPPGFDEIFTRFYNNHGMIFVFFSLNDVKNNPRKVIESVLKYLKPIRLERLQENDFTSKVFLIGTFLDQVINDGIDDNLSGWTETFAEYKDKKGIADSGHQGHLNFILDQLGDKKEEEKVIIAVKEMLQAFNVDLTDAIASYYSNEIVPNDGDDLLYFPLSNNLPTMCKTFKCDFDDISGINKFRAKVRSLIDNQQIKVINVMKSLRDAKIIDLLVARKSQDKLTDEDNTPNYILLKDFEKLAATAGITSRAQIAILLRYLDVTGIVSWLSDSQTLQNVIILNPDYVIGGLEKFYQVMTINPKAEEALKKLKEDADAQGLTRDIDNLETSRVVSHDLLLEKLISRDNYEYFKDFLLRSYHLNRINIDVLKKMFVKQNLCSFSGDELYLVPSFEGAAAEANLEKMSFLKYKAKFVPEKGVFVTGSFERALTSLIESFNNDAMEEQLSKTENVLEYTPHFARFTFDEDVFTIAQLKGTDENEKSGFLQFEFTEGSASKFLDFIERVLRNNLFTTSGFVYDGNEWVSFKNARENKVAPYFVQKETTFNEDILEDAFDEL